MDHPWAIFAVLGEAPARRLAFRDCGFITFAGQGVANMGCSGFDESVIMKVGGWKTSSVFRRYNIVDDWNIAEVTAMLDEKRKKQFEDGHSSGIIECFEQIEFENGKIN
jgi:hypothetical protein